QKGKAHGPGETEEEKAQGVEDGGDLHPALRSTSCRSSLPDTAQECTVPRSDLERANKLERH
ncbi:MAG: hypothetical protein ACE5MG_03825, partial [Candidatus Methylomirabilales bacterium]